MGAPNFGLIGTAERYKELVLGSLETAVKKVETVKNAGGLDVIHSRGSIVARDSDGKYDLLLAADLSTPGGSTAVADEAVATGNGTLKEFPLANKPVLAASVVVKVADIVTEVTVDPLSGTVTFAEAPVDSAAITASYRYYDPLATFPSGVCAVLAEDVAIKATSESTAQMVIKAEVAEDLLVLEGTAWADLEEAVQVKARNLLNASGIIPGKVKR